MLVQRYIICLRLLRKMTIKEQLKAKGLDVPKETKILAEKEQQAKQKSHKIKEMYKKLHFGLQCFDDEKYMMAEEILEEVVKNPLLPNKYREQIMQLLDCFEFSQLHPDRVIPSYSSAKGRSGGLVSCSSRKLKESLLSIIKTEYLR